MSDPIIVTFEATGLTKSGHKFYITIEGSKYYVNKDKNIPIILHSPAKLLCSIQDIGGKKLHWINWAEPADGVDQHTPKPMTAPVPPKTNSNTSNPWPIAKTGSRYTDEDKQAFKAKSDQIRQIAALNNAVQMTLACSNSANESHFNGMKIAEVIKYWKDLQNSFYKDYLKQLSGGDKTSPAGIEDAEEVSDSAYTSGEDMG